MKFRIFLLIASFILVSSLLLASCMSSGTSTETGNTSQETSKPVTSDVIRVSFSGTGYTISDASACIEEGKSLVLTKAGTYSLSGELTDGQVVVRVSKDEEVTLELNNVSITCSTSSAISVESADKVTLFSVAGTTNTFTDGTAYSSTTGPNACIHSKDDLTFEGNGTIIIHGNYNHAVKSNNDIKIKSGTIQLDAVGNAIRGNDSVTITGGTVNVTSCKDGLKASTTDKEGKGFVLIEGGSVTLTCSDDAIQAILSVTISGGLVTVSAQGDVVNCAGTVDIAQGCLVQK